MTTKTSQPSEAPAPKKAFISGRAVGGFAAASALVLLLSYRVEQAKELETALAAGLDNGSLRLKINGTVLDNDHPELRAALLADLVRDPERENVQVVLLTKDDRPVCSGSTEAKEATALLLGKGATQGGLKAVTIDYRLLSQLCGIDMETIRTLGGKHAAASVPGPYSVVSDGVAMGQLQATPQKGRDAV